MEELKIGKPATGEIVIYLARNMRGNHRHIFTEEPDLRHPEDAAFNDAVSSFVILEKSGKLSNLFFTFISAFCANNPYLLFINHSAVL